MIEVGLVGFGLAGRYFHAQVIGAVPGLRISAILQRTGNEAAESYPDARIVRSLHELLAIDSIRLIVIASPNQTHFPFAKECLEAGRDVVVDKPFTTTLAEAVELFEIARKYRRVLTVYHSRRFDADFRGMRHFLQKKMLGRIVRFETHYDRYRPSGKPGAWREQPGPGSGILFDLAPHLIDHALMLFGTPQAISAEIRAERDESKTDDAFDISLVYEGNMRAQLCASMLCLIPRPRFLVLGTQGGFLKRGFDPLENALRNGHVPAPDGWMMEESRNWGEAEMMIDGRLHKERVASSGDWRDFYVNVRDVLLGEAELLVTPRQVLDVMSTLELAQRSSAEKRVLPWCSARME